MWVMTQLGAIMLCERCLAGASIILLHFHVLTRGYTINPRWMQHRLAKIYHQGHFCLMGALATTPESKEPAASSCTAVSGETKAEVTNDVVSPAVQDEVAASFVGY